MEFKNNRESPEDRLAEKRQWGPEVCLRQDPEILSVSSPRGFAGLGGLSMPCPQEGGSHSTSIRFIFPRSVPIKPWPFFSGRV